MPLRVFVVEDSKTMLAALAALFESVGDVELAGAAVSEMEATEWLQANASAWDVAIVDLLLDSGSGYNLIPRFKQGGPGRVVVLSQFATHAVQERCLVLGADAVFSKAHPGDFADYLEGLAAREGERPA